MSLRLPLGHRTYRGLMRLLSGPALLWLWGRGFREPGYRLGLKERLGFVPVRPSAMGGLWLHVASVGEAQAALALWPALSAQWGKDSVTWTTQTPAARRLIEQRTHGEVLPLFAPLDTVGATRRFLQRVQPRTLVLMERELWPEWLWQCEQRAIEVAVVNARLKAGAANRWPYTQHWMRQRIQALSQVWCADEVSQQRFERLGLAPVRLGTTGNLKFDLPAHSGDGPTWIAAGHDRRVVVAASTHSADEEAILSAWPTIRSQHPDALLVLAPRHAPRFDAVAQSLIDGGLVLGQTLARRSLGHLVSKDTQIALLDTIGELAQCYPSAQLCLMGGTWANVGGHNALEPLAAGCPVVFGTHTHQFPDLYADMLHAGAALCVNGDAIGTEAAKLLSAAPKRQRMQAAGRAFVDAQRGSAVRTLQGLQQLKSWPVTPMPAVCTAHDAAGTHWFNSDLLHTLPPHAFEPARYPGQTQALATGSGRGQAHRVSHEGQSWVIRHYRRGGWVAKFNADQYPAVQTHDSRAMQEFALLREMHSRGLPAPQPVAARCARSMPWMGSWGRYRADIAVVCIDQSTNLSQRLDHERPEPAIWRAVGQAIAQMHAHQIDHTDLNCHNILINANGQVWLIDFDKCQRRQGDAWKAGNLQRLLRSLRKEQARRTGFHWNEADWADLINGYEENLKAFDD